MELVVFQYMLIVFAQLLTVDSSTVCRHTRNTRVTKDVETMVTTTADWHPSLRHGRPYSASNNHRSPTSTNNREAQHPLHFRPRPRCSRPQPSTSSTTVAPHPHSTLAVSLFPPRILATRVDAPSSGDPAVAHASIIVSLPERSE